MNEVTVPDFASLFPMAADLCTKWESGFCWWRGHAEHDWILKPRLYRDGLEANEFQMNVRFKLNAPARSQFCPPNSDPFGWLYWMQHYRLPTRLLDWSESMLVALYFAVEDEGASQKDAALIALAPARLNKVTFGKQVIATPYNVEVQELAKNAFVRTPSEQSRTIIATMAEQRDLRHLVQQAAVTVHGCGDELESLPNADRFLFKFRVPWKAKLTFKNLLKMSGFTRSSIFPDLENLGSEIASTYFLPYQTDEADGAQPPC